MELLNLDGDEQEEFSTMLLCLQNQVEGGTPNPKIVGRCLDWLECFTERFGKVNGHAA